MDNYMYFLVTEGFDKHYQGDLIKVDCSNTTVVESIMKKHKFLKQIGKKEYDSRLDKEKKRLSDRSRSEELADLIEKSFNNVCLYEMENGGYFGGPDGFDILEIRDKR